MSLSSDTIVALATPPGRGGVAVVRISGPLVEVIAKNTLGKLPKPRDASYATFRDENGMPIDNGLALFFPKPHSFTGEDVLELQGHSGPAVIDLLIKRIVSLGARLARPGEFSERAFLNDKIDLIQAEAIADLIDATSSEAARSAMRSLQGDFSKKITALLEALIQLRMYVEAAIDFSDEEIDFLGETKLHADLTTTVNQLELIQSLATEGCLLREGMTAVIAGMTNVGKSSLLNALSGKERAIVTAIAGTTRDLLHESILIDGMPMHIIDTAGLRESTDQVELEGMRRAHTEIEKADMVLWVVDASSDETDKEINTLTKATNVVIIRNKIDLINEKPYLKKENDRVIISLSAKTGVGIDLFKNYIKSYMGLQNNNEDSFSARRRHLDALSKTKTCLDQAKKQLQKNGAYELLAEDLRKAQLALSEVTGQFTSDDLLGHIFSSFCIGK